MNIENTRNEEEEDWLFEPPPWELGRPATLIVRQTDEDRLTEIISKFFVQRGGTYLTNSTPRQLARIVLKVLEDDN